MDLFSKFQKKIAKAWKNGKIYEKIYMDSKESINSFGMKKG